MKAFLTRATYDTESLAAQLAAVGIELECYPEDTVCPRDVIAGKIGTVDALLTHTEDAIDGELLALASPRLRVIANMGIGYSNIDVAAATEAGVTVTNTPTEEAFEATAEATVALLLAVARRIPALHLERIGLSTDPAPSFLRPTAVNVRGKVTGIVGMGRIGSRVARTLHYGFSNQILYFDGIAKPDLEAEIGARRVALPELMQSCDFICVNMPLSESSRGLVSAAMIELMKPGATLINTARAELLDEAALIGRYNQGLLHGVGLDVYSDRVADLRGDNFVLTSHFCNFEDRAYADMTRLVAENVIGCLAGSGAVTAVNAVERL